MSYLKKLGNTQTDEKVLDLKVFQLYKEIGNQTADDDLDENQKKAFLENRFSLKTFYTLDTSILEKYIFKLEEDQQFVQPEFIMQDPVMEPTIVIKYYQIRRQQIKHSYITKDVLQIIDISSDILYDKAKGEKELQSLINATVSHEMRNPCNSIQGQNIKQEELNNKLKVIIQNDLKADEHEYVRSKLTEIVEDYATSSQI